MIGKRPPDDEAVARLEKAVEKSKRVSTVRFPIAFARGGSGEEGPPLAQMMRGGQGGETALLVYLLLRMMGTKAPHRVTTTAAAIAENLGFPASLGVRRVNGALKKLEAMKLISVESPPGLTRTFEILNPDGSGEQWSDRAVGDRWITLPIALWRRGWLLSLSGRALAILIVLKELTGGRKDHKASADGLRKRAYGFSDETWKRACDELEARGLLTTVMKPEKNSQGEPRRRLVYQLHLDVLSDYGPFEYPMDPDRRTLRDKDRPIHLLRRLD